MPHSPYVMQAPHGIQVALLAHRRPLGNNRKHLAVLCRISNDAAGIEERRALRLVVALDRSGSMRGTKLENALFTLRALIEQLGPEDQFSLVIFDDVIDVLVQPAAVNPTTRELMRSALSRVRARGATDLCGAALQAVNLANAMSPEGGHVIVLTDGAPTSGITDDDQIVRVVGGALQSSTLSVFGYGTDVRPELLGNTADIGRGSYYFVQGNEPPLAAFASELGGQRAIIAVNAQLRLVPGEGVTIRSWPLSCRGAVQSDGVVELSLAPMTAGDTMPLVFALDLAQSAEHLMSPRPWLEARLSLRDANDGSLHELSSTFLPMIAPEDGPYVSEVVRELVIERSAQAIHRAAKSQELRTAHRELRELVDRAGVSSDPQVHAALGLLLQTADGLDDPARREDTHTSISVVARGLSKRKSTLTGGSMAAFEDDRSHSYESKLREPKKPKGD